MVPSDSPEDAEPELKGFQQTGGVSSVGSIERDCLAVSENDARKERQRGQALWRRPSRQIQHRGTVGGSE